MHASNLVLALKGLDAKIQFRGMGGSYSKEAGVELALDYQDVALMGFIEVIFGFRKVLKYLRWIKKDLISYRPDALILVDFGGFNMKVASYAKKLGIPVHYYIPPKVWAWNQNRAYALKESTDKVYSILPFEPAFFEKFEMNVHYVGNPLLDEIKKFKGHDFFYQKNELSFQPIVALLPGSRTQEVMGMLAKMIALVKEFSQVQFVVAGVDSLPASVYELALAQGIRVIVYRASWISYQIAKRLIRVPYISLPNLIADHQVVRELIQDDFSSINLREELNRLLSDLAYRREILEGYALIRSKIGEESASQQTAQLILGVEAS